MSTEVTRPAAWWMVIDLRPVESVGVMSVAQVCAARQRFGLSTATISRSVVSNA